MAVAEEDYQFLSKFIMDESAIVVSRDKEYLLESRLGPLCRRFGYQGIAELVSAMRTGGAGKLRGDVVEAMTTNETFFFRDQKPFDALRKEVLPALIAQNSATRTLRIWCAACSSGQEPYTIAMIINEYFPELAAWNVKILASDLSPNMVTRTREGVYSQLEVNRGLPAPLLVKYFEKNGDIWSVKQVLKRAIEPFEANLIRPWPNLGRLDLVFMRNVLIYFDVPTKQRVFDNLEKVMVPGAYLFLGGAESTLGLRSKLTRGTSQIAPYYIAGQSQAVPADRFRVAQSR